MSIVHSIPLALRPCLITARTERAGLHGNKTLLAIRKLMSSISKSRINVLFLDEVTNVLDEQGKERLVELLLREENWNTYIVSHGWTHPLLSKIDIIKEQKISRLDG